MQYKGNRRDKPSSVITGKNSVLLLVTVIISLDPGVAAGTQAVNPRRPLLAEIRADSSYARPGMTRALQGRDYFTLLRVGFSVQAISLWLTVVSYTTFSPLPRAYRYAQGSLFSVALSLRAPRLIKVGARALSIRKHAVLRSPDFPPLKGRSLAPVSRICERTLRAVRL